MKSALRRNIALAVAAFCYALIGIFVKNIGGQIPIMTVSFFRMFIGTLFLLLITPFFDKRVFSKQALDVKDNLVIGFLLAVVVSTFNASFLYASISRINLIESSYIVFTVIFAYVFLKERLGTRECIAAIIGILGIILLHPDGNMKIVGFNLAISSGIAYSLSLVYIRKQEKHHTLGTVFWYMAFATLFLLPFPFIYGVGDIQHHLWSLIGIGVLSTGLAYLLLNYALEVLTADFTATFLIIFIPIIAIILAHTVLHETVTGLELVGGGMLALAGIILEWHRS